MKISKYFVDKIKILYNFEFYQIFKNYYWFINLFIKFMVKY